MRNFKDLLCICEFVGRVRVSEEPHHGGRMIVTSAGEVKAPQTIESSEKSAREGQFPVHCGKFARPRFVHVMQNPSSGHICLASSSPYRRDLLDRFLDDYEAISPGVDETNPDGLPPAELATQLARRKAEAVSASARDSLIIGADQLAVVDDTVLGKPGDHQKAVEQLLRASGKTVRFLTAVCILDPRERARYEHTDTTTVRFRSFDRRLADAYLRHDKPYDCAGSFRIEGAGFILFESVQTDDPTALIGLPMIWVADRLLKLGYLLP
ncbi:MAG: Maf family protein [Pseudomonadota bacterium]